jgi:CheY-like chemotaxis protein
VWALLVLLIDDNPVQLKIRENILRIAGLQVASFSQAQSALDLLRSESGSEINGVITDHMMPGIGGVELVRQLRRFNTTIPVLVLSGLPEAEAEYAGLNVVFRQKPCPPTELIELLREAFSADGHHS